MGIFDYIVSLSIRACVLVPIAVAARSLLAKYPKRYSYVLWLIVFASLIVKINIPVAVTTPTVQLQQTIQQQYDDVMESYTDEVVIYQDYTEQYTQAVEQGIQPIISEKAKYVITDAESIAPPKTVKTSVMPKVQILWLAGILAVLILYIRNVLNLLSTVRFAVHYKYDIYYSENIASPFVFGIMKPKIYLPYSITSQQAECVIIHERVHIKRLDYLVKPLCLFIAALHWFNPLVWIAFWLMCKDMEFSCDEAAVRLMDRENKKDYCTALMQFALKDESYKMSTVMFGESDCSRRIKNVLGTKRPYKLIAELLVLVVLTAAIGCTAAEKTTQENPFIGMSIEELEQIVPQSDEERLMIWQAMDTLPDSEIEVYLAEKIEKYCSADNFAVFRDISVHQDHLTLVYKENRKPLQNATAHITLELLPYDTVDIKTEAEQYMADMFSWLGDESEFFSFKVEAAGYTVENENGGKIAHSDADVTDSFIWLNWRSQGPKAWYAAQSKTELSAQKIAFNAVKINKNFMLKKFGIADDGTLRIEYHVEDDYFLKGEEETEEKLAKQTADLNNIYASISEKVLLHEDVRRYIEANGIQNAVIAFSHRFLENGVAEFPLVVNVPDFVPDYDIRVEDSLPEITEDGIPIDEIKQHPGHIAVVPEDSGKTVYYTTVGTSYFNDAVFIGDSIADGLRIYTNLENSLAEIADFVTMANYMPYEFMEAELWNDDQTATGLEHTILLSPNKVYILMGTNSLTFMDEKDFLTGYLDMVKALRKALPDKDIYICSIPPVRADFAETKPIFKSLGYINSQLENFAKDNGAYYLDLHEVLAEEDRYGYLKEEYTGVDGVNLTTKAYTDIIEYLRTHIVAKPDGLALRDYDKFLQAINSSEKGERFTWPTEMGVHVSRGFAGAYPAHDGLDIAGPNGTEIYAAAAGTVTKKEESTVGNGNHIIIDHGDGLRTLYAHCDKLLVKEGEKVTKGQLIATIGSTGNSTGNHLHFGVSRDYVYEDPYEQLGGYPSVCDECGEDVMVWTGNFTQWQPVEQTECVHGLIDVQGYDIICERLYNSTYSCEKCGYTIGQTITQKKNQCVNTQQLTSRYQTENDSYYSFGWPAGSGVSITRGFSDGTSCSLSPRVVEGVIRAVNSGIISSVGDDSLVISNATYTESYAHCAEILVKEGDYVQEDQEIAVLDSSMPADQYTISHHPVKHTGVDIAGEINTEILAAADGVVAMCGEDREFGNYIVLQHENGYTTKYAHCNKLIAKMGERVKKGQYIADMGSTGLSTGVHLHFEIIDKNGNCADPYRYW